MDSLINSLKDHIFFQGKSNFNLVKCPGRISFSKHCDYVNNDLLYIAADYSIYAASAKTLSADISSKFTIKILNLNTDFEDFEIDFTKSYEENENLINSHYKKNGFFMFLKSLMNYF